MKFFLEWRVRGLIAMMMVIGFMMASVDLAQAQPTITTIDAVEIVPYSIPLSPTITIDAAGVVSYLIPLSPTIAIVDASKGLNIRKGPDRNNYGTRGGLLKNDQVIIRGTNSPECLWIYITETSKNFYGWVDSRYLRNLKKNLVLHECPQTLSDTKTIFNQTNFPTPNPTEIIEGGIDSSDQWNSYFQDYNILTIGIAALLLTAFLYWIAYTKGLFTRLRQRESSTGLSANNNIPKAGTSYLEGMQTSAQPIYCPLKGKNISIGRHKENTLVIDSRFAQWDTVSSHHARIEKDGNSFIITDLDSKNGVFVDGRRTQENILYDGMQVSLGKMIFIFRVNG